MVLVTAGLVAIWTSLVDLGSATHAESGAGREAVFLVAEPALVLLLVTDAAGIDPRHLRGKLTGVFIAKYLSAPQAEAPLLIGSDEVVLVPGE